MPDLGNQMSLSSTRRHEKEKEQQDPESSVTIADDQQIHTDAYSDWLCPRASTPAKKGHVRTWPVSFLLGSPPRGQERCALLVLVRLEPKVRPGHRLVASGGWVRRLPACASCFPTAPALPPCTGRRPVAGNLSPHWGADHPKPHLRRQGILLPAKRFTDVEPSPHEGQDRRGTSRPQGRSWPRTARVGDTWFIFSNQFLVKTSMNGN